LVAQFRIGIFARRELGGGEGGEQLMMGWALI
jgi:hypothetical protein